MEEICLAGECCHTQKNEVQIKLYRRQPERGDIPPVGDEIVVHRLRDQNEVNKVQRPAKNNSALEVGQAIRLYHTKPT